MAGRRVELGGGCLLSTEGPRVLSAPTTRECCNGTTFKVHYSDFFKLLKNLGETMDNWMNNTPASQMRGMLDFLAPAAGFLGGKYNGAMVLTQLIYLSEKFGSETFYYSVPRFSRDLNISPKQARGAINLLRKKLPPESLTVEFTRLGRFKALLFNVSLDCLINLITKPEAGSPDAELIEQKEAGLEASILGTSSYVDSLNELDFSENKDMNAYLVQAFAKQLKEREELLEDLESLFTKAVINTKAREEENIRDGKPAYTKSGAKNLIRKYIARGLGFAAREIQPTPQPAAAVQPTPQPAAASCRGQLTNSSSKILEELIKQYNAPLLAKQLGPAIPDIEDLEQNLTCEELEKTLAKLASRMNPYPPTLAEIRSLSDIAPEDLERIKSRLRELERGHIPDKLTDIERYLSYFYPLIRNNKDCNELLKNRIRTARSVNMKEFLDKKEEEKAAQAASKAAEVKRLEDETKKENERITLMRMEQRKEEENKKKRCNLIDISAEQQRAAEADIEARARARFEKLAVV